MAEVGSSGPGKSGSCGEQRRTMQRGLCVLLVRSHGCHPHCRKTRWWSPARSCTHGQRLPAANISTSDLEETFGFTPDCNKKERWRNAPPRRNSAKRRRSRMETKPFCPKPGVFVLRESHRHARAPFANPCSGAVGLAPSHRTLGSTRLARSTSEKGTFFPMEEHIPACRPGISLIRFFFPPSRAGVCPGSVSGRGWRLSPWDLSAQESLEQLPAG